MRYLYHLLAQARLEELRRQARPARRPRTDPALDPPRRTRPGFRAGPS
jgi:hypothetical protein